MNAKYIKLSNRAIIQVTGADSGPFLQGLITGDINKVVRDGKTIYALILNPQGRFLYDLFISKTGEGLLLDCAADSRDELMKMLSFYRLRADVTFNKRDDLLVAQILGAQELSSSALSFLDQHFISFVDPRSKAMGVRIIGPLSKLIEENNFQEANIDFYNHHRLQLGIADDSDLVHNQSLILEYGFDNINAIDYGKGCYIGQEVTARTHYRGVIRKKIYLVEIADLKEIAKGEEIICDDKKIGTILSSVFYNQKLIALALIKMIDADGKETHLADHHLILEGSGNKISIY